LIVVSSKDGRAICEGIPAVDADTGSPAERFGDVEGLREIAPGGFEDAPASRKFRNFSPIR
jgi:hypothetical protein